jgi:hypothetical protein
MAMVEAAAAGKTMAMHLGSAFGKMEIQRLPDEYVAP